MSDHISGKVIAVTGAASGFGRLICEKAAARGARLICADIDAEGLKETLALVHAHEAVGETCLADVTDLEQMKAVIEKAVTAYGSLDVMINNAGIMPLAFFSDHDAAAPAWSRCIDINIKGVMNGIIAAHDQMVAQGHGHVINISSIYGNFPVAGAGVYGATKAAVNFLSESLRVESQGKIKVTIVKPTGVPATNLGTGVVNPAAVTGILGQNTLSYLDVLQALGEGKDLPGQLDPDSPKYVALDPGYIADAVIAAIDQPLGVSTGDITIRATGDAYIL